MINRNKKHTLQKGKVNLVDGLIYLFTLMVIAAMVLVGYYALQNKPAEKNEVKESTGYLTYTVVFHNLNSEDVENIKTLNADNSIKNATNHKNLGVVVGEPIIKTYEEGERIDVILNIKAESTHLLGVGYFIDGEQIRIGSAMTLLSNEREYIGYCIDLAFEEHQEVAQ